MRKKKKGNSVDKNAWLTTYGDLVTLLLCFFVLLYSFSSIDVEKFQQIMNSFQGSLGVLEAGKILEDGNRVSNNDPQDSDSEITEEERKEREDFKILKKYIEQYAKQRGLEDEIKVVMEERGLMVRVLDNVFFDPGKADIKSRAKEIVLYIGDIINKPKFASKHIKVEGHTDNVIMNTPMFPSNWELSVRRATNVLRLLEGEKHINSSRISASGYGPNRPIAPNDTPANKAKNRRVDIVILKSTYSKFEP
ncbi:flagellar motor protein MotB [Clostridiaceae bacterium M8S5]|nr:flagellar motor protein MotB [Clostridiaceae bacterium M8S5]